MDAYPGDDVVDLWGLHEYDSDQQSDPVVRGLRRRGARHGKKVA
jgi:beta-mannanase